MKSIRIGRFSAAASFAGLVEAHTPDDAMHLFLFPLGLGRVGRGGLHSRGGSLSRSFSTRGGFFGVEFVTAGKRSSALLRKSTKTGGSLYPPIRPSTSPSGVSTT